MTTKYLTGNYPAGYVVTAPVTFLQLRASASSAFVDAPGSLTGVTVYNLGRIGLGAIPAGGGVTLGDGDTLRNGGNLYGAVAATIEGSGVSLGYDSVVDNFGTIRLAGDVDLESGAVVNGDGNDTDALIEGYGGVDLSFGSGSVVNFGTVIAHGQSQAPVQYAAIRLFLGGDVTNGTQVDTQARLGGTNGVYAQGAATVTNFGTVLGTGAGGGIGIGVDLTAGGAVTNGGANDQAALIEGYGIGVSVRAGAGTIVNFATIQNMAGADNLWAIEFYDGGSVTNGSGPDRAALIQGYGGLVVIGAAGTVRNFGTIRATGGELNYGVDLAAGGRMTNGAVNDTSALIEGYSGVVLGLGETASNLGTIQGTGASGGRAVYLEGAGVRLTNGAVNSTMAMIEGYVGVVAEGASTLTSFGTVAGAGGVAVQFEGPMGALVVEPGSVFEGQVLGGGGTLVLAGGTGALSSLFGAGGATVSGSMAPTTFQAFDTVTVAAGASFTDADAAPTLVAADKVIAEGALTLAGAVTNGGTIEAAGAGALTIGGALASTGVLYALGGLLEVEGAVTGKGYGKVGNGTLDLTSTFAEAVNFATTSTGTLELARSQTYTGKVSGLSTAGKNALDLGDIAFISTAKTTANFVDNGSKTGGVLTVTDGTHTSHIRLVGDYAGSTFVTSSDGHGGTKVVDPGTGTPTHRFIAAAAGFGATTDGGTTLTLDVWRTPAPALALSRVQIA